MNIIKNEWYKLLNEEFKKDYFLNLKEYLNSEYDNNVIYPHKNDIFNALNYIDYNDVKVVILGQDPYHGPNQAHGFSFSVKPGIKTPPSLLNIYKELNNDLNCFIPNNGYLKKWTEQGVLLLNTVLTVRSGAANSHRKKGWELFTDEIIRLLNNRDKPIVFILWGNNAKSKLKMLTNPNHFITQSVHPSPLSARRGFFGSKPFSKTNMFLKSINEEPIDWQIENI